MCGDAIRCRSVSGNETSHIESRLRYPPAARVRQEMTLDERVDKLEASLDKLRAAPKDRWDKASALAAVLLPIALAFLGYQFASSMKAAEIGAEQRRSDDQLSVARAAAQQQDAIARLNARVSQAEILAHFLDALTGADRAKQRVAIQAVLIALPEDGPRLIQELTEPATDQETKQVAVTALNARIEKLVAGLFDPSSAIRQSSYAQLTSGAWRTNSDVVTPLLTMGRASRDNENGLYNTVVTLKDLSRTVTQPRKVEIDAFCAEISPVGTRIAQQCAGLRTWLNTSR